MNRIVSMNTLVEKAKYNKGNNKSCEKNMDLNVPIYNAIKSHYELLGYKMDNKEEWLDFINSEVKLFCGDNYLSVIQKKIDDAVKKGILEKPEYQPPFEKVHGFEGMVIDYDMVERMTH